MEKIGKRNAPERIAPGQLKLRLRELVREALLDSWSFPVCSISAKCWKRNASRSADRVMRTTPSGRLHRPFLRIFGALRSVHRGTRHGAG